MKNNRNILSTVLLALCLMLMCCIPALAGDGDGSGGGKGNPLMLEESSIADGSTDVALDASIVLTFSKNVVNFSVKENNMTCFALKDSAGSEVAITVEMGDDQVDPDIKRIVTIVPKEKLKKGESYTLVIKKEMQSKSGVNLEKDVEITFTTEGAAAASGNGGDMSFLIYAAVGVAAVLAVVLLMKKKNK